MKIESFPKSGRHGAIVYVNGRYGKVVREYVKPANPRTLLQQAHRNNIRAVSGRWRTLTPEQLAAWRIAAASHTFVTEAGERVRLRAYNFFVSLNTRRADLNLPQFDLPPAEPVFGPNPVGELVITSDGDKFTVKLRVASTPVAVIVVQGPAPVRAGRRCVQHFPFLGLLPPPVDGWSDITELYISRYGAPKPGKAVWIRTFQHIDGWIDEPKVVRFRVPAVTI